MEKREPGNLPEKTVAEIEKKVVTDIHNAMSAKLEIANLESQKAALLIALEALYSCHRAFSSNENWTALDDDARTQAETAINKARGE